MNPIESARRSPVLTAACPKVVIDWSTALNENVSDNDMCRGNELKPWLLQHPSHASGSFLETNTAARKSRPERLCTHKQCEQSEPNTHLRPMRFVQVWVHDSPRAILNAHWGILKQMSELLDHYDSKIRDNINIHLWNSTRYSCHQPQWVKLPERQNSSFVNTNVTSNKDDCVHSCQ